MKITYPASISYLPYNPKTPLPFNYLIELPILPSQNTFVVGGTKLIMVPIN